MWGVAGCTQLATLLLLGQLCLHPHQADPLGDHNPSKAILEMLHIDRLSVPRRSQPHPYMTHIYQLLDSQEARDPGGSDGTLVQSFRSLQGSQFGPPGWIWFNVSHLKPSMSAAELVLLRRTLHPEPLSISVAVHAVSLSASRVAASAALDERPLALDRLPASGYDVFDVSAALAWARGAAGGAAGFQLRYTDESGSLELHEALTQSLYCLNASAQSQPLLVAYRLGRPRPVRQPSPPSSERTLRHLCESAHGRQPVRPGPCCRLHKHYVDFQHLSDWVLQPLGFDFSVCRGTCSPGNWREEREITREEEVKADSSFRSACVAQDMTAMTVMFWSDADDITIARLGNMTAENCVCQHAIS